MSTVERKGYSADVSLKLELGDDLILDVAKVGPDRLVLREPHQLAAGPATLLISVGKSTKRQQVVLSPSGDGEAVSVRYW
jgi:hypothetical protein